MLVQIFVFVAQIFGQGETARVIHEISKPSRVVCSRYEDQEVQTEIVIMGQIMTTKKYSLEELLGLRALLRPSFPVHQDVVGYEVKTTEIVFVLSRKA